MLTRPVLVKQLLVVFDGYESTMCCCRARATRTHSHGERRSYSQDGQTRDRALTDHSGFIVLFSPGYLAVGRLFYRRKPDAFHRITSSPCFDCSTPSTNPKGLYSRNLKARKNIRSIKFTHNFTRHKLQASRKCHVAKRRGNPAKTDVLRPHRPNLDAYMSVTEQNSSWLASKRNGDLPPNRPQQKSSEHASGVA